MIGEGIVSKQTLVPGWHTDQEAEALIYLAQTYVSNGGVVVELGGEYGKSASEFGYALKRKADIHIYTVDLFPDNHHLAKQYGGLWNVWRMNIAETGLCNENMEIVPVPGDSGKIGADWKTPIDLLFVDGDHTYEGVTRDIEMWTPHVKVGGIVVFHDVAKDDNAHYLHQEVLRATTDWYQHKTFVYWQPLPPLPDSLAAFVRVKEDDTDNHPIGKDNTGDRTSPLTSSPSTPEKPKTRKAQRRNRDT